MKGFTLLEILIALSIFAIVAIISTQGLQHSISARNKLQQQTKKLEDLQYALSIIEHDLQQIVPNKEFRGDNQQLTFTRENNSNLDPFIQINLTCKDNKLIRQSITKTLSTNRTLLKKISKCSFSYLNSNNQRINLCQQQLPRAIELNFIGDFGSLILLQIVGDP